MRRIKFDAETILAIKQFIESGHTLDEVCNRFTIKYDTLRRVMHENNIHAFYQDKSHSARKVTDQDVSYICNMYEFTDTRLEDIVSSVKLPNYVVQDILKNHFTEQYINSRKSRLYRKSKLGNNNPMKNMCGETHPNYKGLIDDGNGYYMIMKPDWYTGRKGSDYVFYHSVVMAQALDITEIPKGFAVHHIDGNKHNNDISNLALVTISGHGKWHGLIKKLMQGAETIHNGVEGDPRNA